MGQVANIFGFAELLPAADVSKSRPGGVAIDMARLIPGSNNRRSRVAKQPGLSVRSGASESFISHYLSTFLLADLAPETLFQMARDAVLISAVYVAESQFKITVLNWAMLTLYGLVFLSAAKHAKLYCPGGQQSGQQVTLAKIIGFTTFVVFLAVNAVSEDLSPWPLFVWSGLNWLALSACRQPWRSPDVALQQQCRRVMIVGDPALGRSVAEALGKAPHSSRIVQEFLLDRCLCEPFGSEMMKRIARQGCIDEVIIATPDRAAAGIALREAKRNQLDVMIVPDLQGTNADGVVCVQGIPMVKISEQQFPVWPLALKRCADLALSSAGLLVLSPLLLLIAVVIKLESSGPVLYRASRVGRKATLFQCYKFRTMIRQADQLKNDLRSRNQRDGAFFKIKDDPRITRIGGILRRYSLDELPQLWNVLLGDMSLVGPRPHPADDVDRYTVGDLRRLDFVPGITGLWQVTARQDPSFNRCVELDVEYIRNWSVLLDFKILCRTIVAVLQGSGA